MSRVAIILVVAAALVAPSGAQAELVDQRAEALNLLVSQGRHREFSSPGMTARVGAATSAYQASRREQLAADPERAPDPNSCTTVALCPIDPRLQDWADGRGMVREVLFTARSGATLAGHVWATRRGPSKRPAVLIVNGSIFAIEQFYWYAAQALAKAGYVVLTFDAQGEGMSDQFGEGADRLEGAFAGTPVLGRELGGNGEAFYDGGADALDFLLSTRSRPYVPVPSRGTGTSHAGKQRRRAAAGRNAAYNPLWRMIDKRRVGIVGNSYGAEAASWIGQADPRVDAVVAWDNLCIPVWPSLTETRALAEDSAALAAAGELGGSTPARIPPRCFGALEGPAPELTKPALGISNDYLLNLAPFVTAPDPRGRALASLAYSRAGVDTGEIVIRGGTHGEAPLLPSGLYPATLRGTDIHAWYTTAWFDKYLKRDAGADGRLLTDRWRDDAAGRAADPGRDGNLLSWHFRSRLDIGRARGGRFTCENLRAGCRGLLPAGRDCGPRGSYSAIAVATAREGAVSSSRPANASPPRKSARRCGRR